jgi:multisubunit Na+/H+ antiporter MnhB subunit
MSVIYYIYGLIAAAILITAVLIKYRSKRIRGEWVLAGFLIAVISLPLGLVLTPVVEILTRLFLPEGGFNQIFSVLSMFIIMSICYTYLRKRSAILFVKVLIVSFLGLLLLAVTWFSLSMSGGGMFMVIEVVNIPAVEKVRYIEITQEELERFQPLNKAMNSYTQSNSSEFKIDTEDQRSVIDFFEKKRHAAGFLFSISGNLEENLDKGIVSQKLTNVFMTNNFSLSGNASVIKVNENKWYVLEKQYLFSIMDEGIEKDLNKIDTATGGEIKEIRIPELKNVFEAKGFSLSENYRIWRIPEKWNINDERVNYEIWKEDGKLNVYDGKSSADIFFRIDKKYYKISYFFAD